MSRRASLEKPCRAGYHLHYLLSRHGLGRAGSPHTFPSLAAVCIVYDDRLLAHQPLSHMRHDCFVGTLPWVNETVCNCTGTAAPKPTTSNPSTSYVGRAPVYMP